MLHSSCTTTSVVGGNVAATDSEVERHALATYHPPSSVPPPKQVHYVYNPSDGSVLMDHKGRPVTVNKLLATKPLRGELSSRPGPGNKKLTYISGEGITRTLNDIFGFDGWNLDTSRVQREECLKDEKTGKFTVVYTAMVRLTHRSSGSYREDCGAGDSTDRCFGTAVSHALKASITDAIKRAARHFGDKLGNSLYQGSFTASKAPVTLKDALDKCDIERANSKFGFRPDPSSAVSTSTTSSASNQTTATATTTAAATATATKPITATAASSISGSNSAIDGTNAHQPPSNNTSRRTVLQKPHNATNNASTRVVPPGSATNSTNSESLRYSGLNNVHQQPVSTNRYTNQSRPSTHHFQEQQTTSAANSPNSGNETMSDPTSGSSNSAVRSPPETSPQPFVMPPPPQSHLTTVLPPPQQLRQPRHSHPHAHPPGQLPRKTLRLSPPPTPMDTLRNSALFGYGGDLEQTTGMTGDPHATTPPDISPQVLARPQSSYGRKTALTIQTLGDPRRSSIGNGLPIQPPPMVTPTSSVAADVRSRSSSSSSSSSSHHLNKRSATVPPLEPLPTKKMNVNPYSGRQF